MTTEKQPLWAVTPEKIAEAVRRIVAAVEPVRIILFGSVARGEAWRDSDLDLVVVERDVIDRYAETVRLRRALWGLILPVDILVIGDRDFEEWSATPGSVRWRRRFYTKPRRTRRPSASPLSRGGQNP